VILNLNIHYKQLPSTCVYSNNDIHKNEEIGFYSKDIDMNFQTIISVSDLVENLHSTNWLILDCRNISLNTVEDYREYNKNHIPNAVYFCINDCFHSDSNDFHNNNLLTTRDLIIYEWEQKGINKDSQIVLYGNNDETTIDQLWLFLRSIGFKNIAVLQGGFTAWENSGQRTHSNNIDEMPTHCMMKNRLSSDENLI